MPISLRLPADIEDRLSNLALKTGRTKTSYATQAICEQIDDLEDIYLAKKEMKKIRSGKGATTPLSELMNEYGLAR
ncbi:MAG: type II toxin-antitoxin system RelB family antitoxin [Burkholderiaceae bacterium]|jgi:RHH-type rel operon transcriptional repressor/antitoxin RelB